MTIVRLEPGRGFLERSPMLSQRVWEHERRLRAVAGGCEVVDRVRFEPRLRVGQAGGWLMTKVFREVFRHRHRRLARHFGRAPTGSR